MRKLRDRLNNKKGFTLVELIVVIVIILILAAVLVPNVMRYIGQAREAAFQSEASTYLTELQGYAAEVYATTDADMATLPTGESLTEFPSSGLTIKVATAKPTGMGSLTEVSAGAASAKIYVEVYHGAVTAFTYQNKEHGVNWCQAKGWSNVDKKFPADS